MTYLVEDVSREFRSTQERVFDENRKCIFICPPVDRVNLLMKDVYEWLNEKGVVNLTIPDKPTSKNQMYYKN